MPDPITLPSLVDNLSNPAALAVVARPSPKVMLRSPPNRPANRPPGVVDDLSPPRSPPMPDLVDPFDTNGGVAADPESSPSTTLRPAVEASAAPSRTALVSPTSAVVFRWVSVVF